MRRIFVTGIVIALVACGRNSGPAAPSTAAPSTAPTPPASGGTDQRVFEITFVADDAACRNLPQEARRRTYTTTLSQGLDTLAGAKFVPATRPYSTWNVLYTKLADQSADIWFQDPPIWEALSDESYLVIFGDAHGEISGDTATLPFWAKFQYCPEREQDDYPECEVPETTCESRNNQLILRLK